MVGYLVGLPVRKCLKSELLLQLWWFAVKLSTSSQHHVLMFRRVVYPSTVAICGCVVGIFSHLVIVLVVLPRNHFNALHFPRKEFRNQICQLSND